MKGGEELLQRIEAGLQCRPYNVGLQCRPYMTKNIWFVLYSIFVLLYFVWLFYSAEEYNLSKFSMAGGLHSLLPRIKFSFILGSLIISLIRCFIPLTTNNTNYAKELREKKRRKILLHWIWKNNFSRCQFNLFLFGGLCFCILFNSHKEGKIYGTNEFAKSWHKGQSNFSSETIEGLIITIKQYLHS